ncbi:MAG: hypothetical protein ACOYXR_11120 [Nitrospirota bacterium]
MIARLLTAGMVAVGITLPVPTAAAPAPGAAPTVRAPAPDSAVPSAQPTKKSKPRRVIIFGTTIVGDVLTPTTERPVPWQRPAAFRSNAAPLVHDFTVELLTPLDRGAILRETNDHEH